MDSLDDLKDSLKRYVEHRTPPGDFLLAVLENNLMEAMGRADELNRYRIYDICVFIYNYLPAVSHGSPERVQSWLCGNER